VVTGVGHFCLMTHTCLLPGGEPEKAVRISDPSPRRDPGWVIAVEQLLHSFALLRFAAWTVF